MVRKIHIFINLKYAVVDREFLNNYINSHLIRLLLSRNILSVLHEEPLNNPGTHKNELETLRSPKRKYST